MPPAKQPFASMTSTEYRAALKRLGFADAGDEERSASNDEGLSRAARFFGATARTGQAWATRGPPGSVAIALRLMLALNLTVEKANALLQRKRR